MGYELGKIRTDRGEFVDKGNHVVSVLHQDFYGGARGDGVWDDTKAIQAAIDYAVTNHIAVYFPVGTYRVTDTLTIYNGSQLIGETGFCYVAGFGKDPQATRINFEPTSEKSLFEVDDFDAPSGGFRFHMSMEGFYLHGNSVAGGDEFSLYGLHLQGVIHARFENIGIEGFQYPIGCGSTINNRFVNVFCMGTVACVRYLGTAETTDTWTQCTFTLSPVGVVFDGSSIGVRFEDCIWEALDNYGIDMARECQNIHVSNGYCEDVPLLDNAAGAMFRVGFTGSALVVANHLTVTGGTYQGRSAGNAGSFLDADYASSIILVGVYAARYTNVIQTSANTQTQCVSVAGFAGVSWTNSFADDYTKITGVYPNTVINGGSYGQAGRFAHIDVGSALAANSVTSGLYQFPATQTPHADPNTLDDYEEGTWTPAVGGTATYTLQTGRYTKIGRQVSITAQLTINAIGTGNQITISGLPFAAGSVGSGNVGTFSGLASAVTSIFGIVSGSTFTLNCLTVAAVSAVAPALLTSGTSITFAATYTV